MADTPATPSLKLDEEGLEAAAQPLIDWCDESVAIRYPIPPQTVIEAAIRAYLQAAPPDRLAVHREEVDAKLTSMYEKGPNHPMYRNAIGEMRVWLTEASPPPDDLSVRAFRADFRRGVALTPWWGHLLAGGAAGALLTWAACGA